MLAKRTFGEAAQFTGVCSDDIDDGGETLNEFTSRLASGANLIQKGVRQSHGTQWTAYRDEGNCRARRSVNVSHGQRMDIRQSVPVSTTSNHRALVLLLLPCFDSASSPELAAPIHRSSA